MNDLLDIEKEFLKKANYLKNKKISSKTQVVFGYVSSKIGNIVIAKGFNANIGTNCLITSNNKEIKAQVVGFLDNKIYLMPFTHLDNLEKEAKVTPILNSRLKIGYSLLGRIVDPFLEPLDSLGAIKNEKAIKQNFKQINPLERENINQVLDVGIKAINSMLTIGKGQRMGLFAGTGVGKSVLLGMMTKGTKADITVVALVGERGREVKEFVDEILTKESRKNTIVLAAAADSPAIVRQKCFENATHIAEYFKDQGNNVLLLVDSLTRYAQASREVALAIGEVPVAKGYPPSTFYDISCLIERAGISSKTKGSITAFYTILVEGDDLKDPVADNAMAILDGHIVLSRVLADKGIYPAIDLEKSISRSMKQIVSKEHFNLSLAIKNINSIYLENKDLIAIGAYKKGSDPLIDKAVEMQKKIINLVSQNIDETVSYQQSFALLKHVSSL